MPSVIIFGRRAKDIEPMVRSAGFDVVEKEPEMVLSYGGDGTLMHAEHAYPGVLKVLLRDSVICKKCSKLSNEEVLDRVLNGTYRMEEMSKLEVQAGDKTMTAINDIIVHNGDPRHAIRYSVHVDGCLLGDNIIGDGVVVATPFGSTAYYRSITDSSFEIGIGLAFNNSTEQSDHHVLAEDSMIKLNIVRGPAMVYADNQDESIKIGPGEDIIIRRSSKRARIVVL